MSVASDARLEAKVSDFLRIGVDDPTLKPLIAAARVYLSNAGVIEPEDEDPLYDLAVTLYVNTIYSGGEDKLQDAMTSMILQLRA